MALPKRRRLKKTRDIERVLKKSQKAAGGAISLRVHWKEAGPSRFTVVVPKKVSKKSVVRHRLQRRIGEWIRVKVRESEPVDGIVRVGPGALALDAKGLISELEKLMKQIGVRI